MMQRLVFYFLLWITIENFCLSHPCTLITHQMFLFDHVAIFCFVFTDRFYGRQSDNSLKCGNLFGLKLELLKIFLNCSLTLLVFSPANNEYSRFLIFFFLSSAAVSMIVNKGQMIVNCQLIINTKLSWSMSNYLASH